MSLYEYDREIFAQGYRTVCGVDEAGRGPLAGPVYAVAVVLPPDIIIEGLNDSKKLTAKKRDALYDEITARAVCWSVAFATREEIDGINIRQAALLAMRRAVGGLTVRPDCALVDGDTDPCLDIHTKTIIKGDAASACIAAASILAKVARDRVMDELHMEYPQYGFAKHKGYGTKLHFEMLDAFGPCPEHRRTFLRKWEAACGGR